MKDHDLLEAVGGINEKYIKNAVDIQKNNVHRRYGKWIAVAACVCIAIELSLMAPSFIKLGNNEGNNVPDNSGGYASEEKQANVSQEESASAESGDYAPMIMIDGIVYVDLYEKYEGNIDYEHVEKVLSYVDSKPTKNGEQNFNRTSSTEYFILDRSRIVVNIDDEWRVFGASQNAENEVPEEYLDPTYGMESEDAPVDESTYSEARNYSENILDLQNRISAAMGPGNELSFVTASMILENPDRVHVFVNTDDEKSINLLKSYNTENVILEIEFSTGDAIEE